jgi:hypothetical protein
MVNMEIIFQVIAAQGTLKILDYQQLSSLLLSSESSHGYFSEWL